MNKEASKLLIRRKKDQIYQRLKEIDSHIEEEDRMSTISMKKKSSSEEVRKQHIFVHFNLY